MSRLRILAAAIALTAATPAAAHAASFTLAVPPPGQVQIQAISVSTNHPTAVERKDGLLAPRFKDAAKLPASVRVVYLRRTYASAASVKSVVMFVVVNRGKAAATAPQPTGATVCQANRRVKAAAVLSLAATTGNGPPCYVQAGTTTQWAGFGLDVPARSELLDLVANDPKAHFGPFPAFHAMETNPPADLVTGRYDNGHPFAWAISTSLQRRQLFTTASWWLYGGGADIDDLELLGGTDLNGNGVVGDGPGTPID